MCPGIRPSIPRVGEGIESGDEVKWSVGQVKHVEGMRAEGKQNVGQVMLDEEKHDEEMHGEEMHGEGKQIVGLLQGLACLPVGVLSLGPRSYAEGKGSVEGTLVSENVCDGAVLVGVKKTRKMRKMRRMRTKRLMPG